MYGNRLYKQTDGVTMKSAWEPTSANFYLEHIEELFDDNEIREQFFVLNSPHQNLKSTIEKATVFEFSGCRNKTFRKCC